MKTISNNSRKLFGVFLSIGILLTATVATAQPADSVSQRSTQNKELKFPKNNFKINLSSLVFKSYSLYYERSLSRKISFSAGYRTMPSTNLGGLPLVKKLNEKFNDGDELLEGINRMEASGNAYTGEFRFYGGKKPGARGFYLALYGRYATFNHDYDYRFTTRNNSAVSIPINSKANGFGGGLMLGTQWLIAKRVNLDVYILGAHYGKLTGTSKGPADLSSLSETDKQDLKNKLEGILIIKEKPLLSTTVNNQGVTGKIDGPFAGVRGLGFSLGIAF
jgi:hypothetical protein